MIMLYRSCVKLKYPYLKHQFLAQANELIYAAPCKGALYPLRRKHDSWANRSTSHFSQFVYHVCKWRNDNELWVFWGFFIFNWETDSYTALWLEQNWARYMVLNTLVGNYHHCLFVNHNSLVGFVNRRFKISIWRVADFVKHCLMTEICHIIR